MMEWYKILFLITTQNWISVVGEVLYVLPDNSTNVLCPSQPCATLSQHLLHNGTLPVVPNVEYHFLPGEHHVPANMTLQNLHNFSIIGTVNNSSSPVILVGCSQSYIIKIINSYSVTIANVVFAKCNQLQLMNVEISMCYSCAIENITFMNSGLNGLNLVGESYLAGIVVKLKREKPSFLAYCQGIIINYNYWDQHFTDNNHVLIMKQMKFIGDNNRCYGNNAVGLYVKIFPIENLTIILKDSLFHNLDHTALSIISRYEGNITINIENCAFEKNTYSYHDGYVTLKPLIDVRLSHDYKLLSFKRCNFTNNHNSNILIYILIRASKACHRQSKYCNTPSITNISFVKCQFYKNVVGILISADGFYYKANLLIIGPSQFIYTKCGSTKYDDYNVLSISNMAVNITGPVILSSNHAQNMMCLKHCNVLFYNKITFKANNCDQIMYLHSTSITIMEYANITLFKNGYRVKVITTVYDYEYSLYPPCLFQFVAWRNTTPSPTLYSVNIIDNFHSDYKIANKERRQNCLFPYYHFTPHCYWLPTATFHDYNPKVIYQQIIKTDIQEFTHHKICRCFQNATNCDTDTFGPVYPGQMLQVELCMPCNNKPSTLYAEINNIHLPNSACKVAPQAQTTNIITSYSKIFNFMIVAEATNECELFLIAISDIERITEAFYVKLITCPVGFTLQNGICDCDPLLSSYIDKCYLDCSSISRSPNTWITARAQTNNTKYLISDCPMDYCLPYSSNVNLLYPDLQCQFNRTGMLCSQCQHPLSMVFASSRCMKCTNVHILITIIVIAAGIVLVILLYLLNLTVTNGTINGIIFYANIVSINDSVFLVNDNVFKPLTVFISFLNLDLGIETCFYNGMDSYVKKWLQLFFPFYLIIIAISIITASRYSTRILRLTYTRSLPVLATLFLLSYTGVLRTVLIVLFSYSTITHLPSGHQQLVWSIDASVPLFGLKFTILFITCLVLFLLLIPFNITLLFTRCLLKFRIINRFKPILDAFQGSYKDGYYYWVAVHMTMRSLFFAMYAFQANLKLILSTMLLIIFSICSGCIYPYKNKLVNIQELLLLINLTIMYAVSYQYSKIVFSIVINIMISLAFIQFCAILLYHFLTYTCHYDVEIALKTLRHKLLNLHNKSHSKDTFDVELLNIPDCTYDYTKYQDRLVSDDFK